MHAEQHGFDVHQNSTRLSDQAQIQSVPRPASQSHTRFARENRDSQPIARQVSRELARPQDDRDIPKTHRSRLRKPGSPADRAPIPHTESQLRPSVSFHLPLLLGLEPKSLL